MICTTMVFVALAAHQSAPPAMRSMQAKPGTPASISAWQKSLRGKLVALLKINDLIKADRKIPFQPETVGTWEAEGYKITRLKIRSTPGRMMDVVLTIPNGASGKSPAVVCIGGHGSELYTVYTSGKPFADQGPKTSDGAMLYKGFASDLAKRGFVTIATVVSQHEVYEPNRTLMGERLWDLMRCVSYLRTLKEVDRDRIGCGGLSLGGEMAMWLPAMDTRVAASVSCGFLTTMDHMERNHCMCWKFDGLRELVDYADIYALTAPRALQCQNGRKEPAADFTPELAQKALTEIKPIYDSLGKSGMLELDIHAGAHEVDVPELVRFFETHLKR